MTTLRLLSLGVTLLFLSACGGGGGGFEPAEPTAARGLYSGPISNGRALDFVVLGDGTYWGVYSTVADDNLVAGLIQGQGSTSGTAFTSSNGRDFNLEGLGIQNLTLNAEFDEMTSFEGTARYSPSNEVTFTATYDDDFELTPSLASVAGTFSGMAASSGGTESATLSISAVGAVTGSGSSGCTFSGTIAPRADGNVYDVSISFNGGTCVNGTATTAGIGVYDATAKQLIAAVLNGSRTDGAIFVGTKP